MYKFDFDQLKIRKKVKTIVLGFLLNKVAVLEVACIELVLLTNIFTKLLALLTVYLICHNY